MTDMTITITDDMTMTMTMTPTPDMPVRPVDASVPASELQLRERKGTFRPTNAEFQRVTINRALRRQLAAAMRAQGVRPDGDAWDTAKRSLKSRLARNAPVAEAIAGAAATAASR